MPKMKTHKGAKKRLKITKTGKVVSKRAGKGHLMSTKTGKRRRQLGRSRVLSKGEAKRYTRALGGR